MNALIIGGGPAGLMAAEALTQAGHPVEVFDAMPSVGRKFLLAGKGGLNLTHSEALEPFLARYGSQAGRVQGWLQALSPTALRQWAQDLGIDTFVGSSGRVFPKEMKAAPLLRAWLRRLRSQGVDFHMRHRWKGWTEQGELTFQAPGGEVRRQPRVTILALGGASWARLGSDGAWVPWLQAKGVEVAQLVPSNCGFEVAWSEHFRERFAGSPLKSVEVSVAGERRRGEFVVSQQGVEGSLIYPFSPALREEIARLGSATLRLDLTPDQSLERLTTQLSKPRGSKSMSSHLGRAGLEGVKAGLLREALSDLSDPTLVAATAKSLPLVLLRPRPLDEAISSGGGVCLEQLDDQLMVRSIPGLFCAGEMLDWEAPTGGYLLTASMASGRVAGRGAARTLQEPR